MKPYLPFDRIDPLRVPGWVERWGSRGQFKRREVTFTPGVKTFLHHAVQEGLLEFYGPAQGGE